MSFFCELYEFIYTEKGKQDCQEGMWANNVDINYLRDTLLRVKVLSRPCVLPLL